MTLHDFVKELNQSFPSSEQIIARYKGLAPTFSKKDAITYRDQNLIQLIKPLKETPEDLAIQLVQYTNINVIGIGGIDFHLVSEKDNSDLVEFASYNSFANFYLNRANGKIVTGADTDELTVFCNSGEDFLKFLLEYNKFYSHLVFGVSYEQEKSIAALRELINHGLSKRWTSELLFTLKDKF